MIKRFRNKEQGQGMVEYGLILALVSIVSLVSLSGIGGKVKDTFDNIFDGSDSIAGGGTENITDKEVDDLIEKGYIIVANPEDLQSVGNGTERTWGVGTKWAQDHPAPAKDNHMGAKFIQVQDIDLSGVVNFTPIGTNSNGNRFKGTFDGGGYTIKNLTVDHGDYAGLFGMTEGATLKNIGLVHANIKGRNDVGGLVGYSRSSNITGSYATGTVTGDDSIGGLVGYNYSSIITDSYATGTVTGTGTVKGTGNYIGGLVGESTGSSTITGSYATGMVDGKGYYVGGLVGWNKSTTITSSYATGAVDGSREVGGLVGRNDASIITGSYATGTVDGFSNYVGGLVGRNISTSTITGSYATGTVEGNANVGGLVGQLFSGTVENSGWANDVGGAGTRTGIGTGGTGTNNKGQRKEEIDGLIKKLGL